MESIFNCDLCSSQFTLNCVPYELPCRHRYCYKCLSSISSPNEETIVCKKDDKTFNTKFQDIPIANFFLKFLNPSLCAEIKLVCLDHNNKDIEFLCHEHSTFLCPLCFWDHCEHKVNLTSYNSDDLNKDLKKVENRLMELEEKLKFFFSQLTEIKTNKINGSKRVALFFKEVFTFLKNPFIETADNEKEDIFSLIGGFERKFNSNILKNENNIKFISNYFEKPITHLKLLFRASEFNYNSQMFHHACDNKGSTLTLIKAKNGNIFGGYNKASWNSIGNYSASEGNFIFSVDKKSKHEVYQNQGNAIYCHANYGPTFGGHDIYVANSCNNNITSSSNLGHTYKPPGNIAYNTELAKNYFAGSNNFVVEEYEVFLIYTK